MVLYTGMLGCANRLCSLYLRTLPGTKIFILSIVYLKCNANATCIFPILLPVVNIYIYIFFFFTAQTSFSLFWHLLHCISTGMAVFLSSGLNGSHPGGNPFNYVLHYMYLHKHRFSYTDIGYQPGWMSFELISISGIFY